MKKKQNQTKIFLPWRLSMLPLKEQRAICTLYSFYRHLEGLSEKTMPKSKKKELLQAWYKEIDNIYDRKTPASKIGRSIYKNCMRFKLPKEDMINLLNSVSMDTIKPIQAPSLKDLEKYCNGIACSPSRMFLRILGCNDEEILKALSQKLGSAIQITNILLNVREDAEGNRLYIPKDFLCKAGIETTVPQNVLIDKKLNIAREQLAEIAEKNYKESFDLINGLDKKIARNIKAVAYIYKKYFDLMNKRGWEIISPKPKLNYFSKALLIIKAYSGK